MGGDPARVLTLPEPDRRRPPVVILAEAGIGVVPRVVHGSRDVRMADRQRVAADGQAGALDRVISETVAVVVLLHPLAGDHRLSDLAAQVLSESLQVVAHQARHGHPAADARGVVLDARQRGGVELGGQLGRRGRARPGG